MGKSKRKDNYLNNYLANNPFCVYCSGNAETIDHVPSRQFFLYRDRPKGLEVPACSICNKSTGGHEQVAAMLTRMYPDIANGKEKKELTHITRGVHKWNPLILKEMLETSWLQQYDLEQEKSSLPPETSTINVNGPLINHSINTFCAKLIFSLDYNITKRYIPPEGGVAIRWFSNHQRMTNRFPDEVMKIFGNNETLRQGKKDVSEQFGYSYAVVENNTDLAIYYAYFRQAFYVIGAVRTDRSKFPDTSNSKIFKPGFAKEKDFMRSIF